MTWYRRYKALFLFEARSGTELTMSPGDTLLVGQLTDGSWPPPNKWMHGMNEATSQQGEFPGDAYVEFVEEFVEPVDSPPEEEEPPPLPPLPPQPSPRHPSQQGFPLPGLGKPRPSKNHEPSTANTNAMNLRVSADDVDDDSPPPAPPPRGPSRGSLPQLHGTTPVAPPKPAPRTAPRKRSEHQNSAASLSSSRATPTAEDQHRWSRVTFSIPVQCAGCKL